MNITVSDAVLEEHFWEEPPPGNWEFWAFRFKPRCQVGDEIIFRHNYKPIAKAIIAKIEPPGISDCEITGEFKNRWKVFWNPASFEDLREKK